LPVARNHNVGILIHLASIGHKFKISLNLTFK